MTNINRDYIIVNFNIFINRRVFRAYVYEHDILYRLILIDAVAASRQIYKDIKERSTEPCNVNIIAQMSLRYYEMTNVIINIMIYVIKNIMLHLLFMVSVILIFLGFLEFHSKICDEKLFRKYCCSISCKG